MPSRTKPGVVVAQVLSGSAMTWLGVAALATSIHLFGDKQWRSALQISIFFVIVLVLGYAAVGLGSGTIVEPTAIFKRLFVSRRERVTDDPGGLTPLGLALFIMPQLVVVAVLLGD
jgi:hypothetical protein